MENIECRFCGSAISATDTECDNCGCGTPYGVSLEEAQEINAQAEMTTTRPNDPRRRKLTLIKLKSPGSEILVNVNQIVAIEALTNTTWTGKPKPGGEYKNTIRIAFPNGKSVTVSGKGVLQLLEYLRENAEIIEFPGMDVPLFSL